jgi:hypothetical protein
MILGLNWACPKHQIKNGKIIDISIEPCMKWDPLTRLKVK